MFLSLSLVKRRIYSPRANRNDANLLFPKTAFKTTTKQQQIMKEKEKKSSGAAAPVVDIVPNGVAFNLAKSWLSSSSSASPSLLGKNFSLETFLTDSKREEREEKPRALRLGLGAKYLSHSKASRTMRDIAEKKILRNVEREKRRREEEERDLKRAMMSSSSSSSDEDDESDEEDVRGLSMSKKRKLEKKKLDASKRRQ